MKNINPFKWYSEKVKQRKIKPFYFFFFWITFNLLWQILGLFLQIPETEPLFLIINGSLLLIYLFNTLFLGFSFSTWKTQQGYLIIGIISFVYISILLASYSDSYELAVYIFALFLYALGYFWGRKTYSKSIKQDFN